MLPGGELGEIFVQSCREQLAAVESDLLDLAAACSGGGPLPRRLLENVFRAAHSVKADAAAMGLGVIVALAHSLENVLQRLTDGRLAGDAAVQPLLAGFDLLGRLAGGPAAGEEEAAVRLAARLESLGRAPWTWAAPGNSPGSLPAPGEPACRLSPAASDPAPGPASPGPPDTPWAASTPDEELGPDAEPWAQRRFDRVTVSAQSLDDLVDQLSDLAACQARVARLAERSGQPELLLAVEELERAAEVVRARAVDMRLLPLRLVFGRFRRMVHDLARELGREADLTVSGEDVRVDKAALEQLGGVLAHLLRNAVDHGVEPPERRLAAGKARSGAIRLSAEQEGGEVVIEVADDGAGIDLAAVRAAAEARGLVASGARLSQAETLELIFAPGFSTAPGVSEVSGRGVGLDAVRATVRAMRGSLSVSSEPGRGATMRLRLPLSLSLLECLLVRCCGTDCFIRLDAVEECVDLDGLRQEDGLPGLLPLRGCATPLLDLARLFGGGAGGPPASGVVARDGEGRCVLAVQEIVGRRQALYKKLPAAFGRAPFVQGCAVSDDGRMGLILDIPGLAAFAAARATARQQGGSDAGR